MHTRFNGNYSSAYTGVYRSTDESGSFTNLLTNFYGIANLDVYKRQHYHRFKEDVKLMKEIGLHAYRFSINWSRVLPNGYGQVNEKGIAFYNALINELLANDIEPYITLYHWELPYELYKRGGWLNPQIVDWFGDYARLIAERFSDRVKNFFTLNEPQCFVGLGFLTEMCIRDRYRAMS